MAGVPPSVGGHRGLLKSEDEWNLRFTRSIEVEINGRRTCDRVNKVDPDA